MPVLSPAQLAAGDALFAVTIEWAGRAWRWSSAPADVTWTRVDGEAAEAVLLPGGLPMTSVERAMATMSSAPDLRTLSVELVWPEDVAAIIATGHDLASAVGELAVLTEDMDWRDRVVLLRGAVSQPEYGADGEPVALSIVEETGDDTAPLLPPTARITREKFATCAERSIGKYYPIVLGEPGVRTLRDGTERRSPGPPAWAIEYDETTSTATILLVCLGRAEATSVRIAYIVDEATVAATSALAIAYDDDADGNRYGYVDISGEAAIVRGSGQWWTCWTEGGGAYSVERNRAVSTIGEAMLWAASKSALRIDRARWTVVADRLTWPIGTYIDDPCAPMAWLQDALLPLAPVALTHGLGGLGPVLWRHDAKRPDAVRTITGGDGYWRAGRVSYTRRPRDIVGEARVRWAEDGRRQAFAEETVCLGELARNTASSGTELGALRQGATLDARRSLSMYRQRRSETIDAVAVWDAMTAWRVAAWRVRSSALSWREVDYDCTTEVLEVEEGDVVILVDEELSLDVVAFVASITISDAAMLRVRLQILDPAETVVLETPPYATENDPRYGEAQ